MYGPRGCGRGSVRLACWKMLRTPGLQSLHRRIGGLCWFWMMSGLNYWGDWKTKHNLVRRPRSTGDHGFFVHLQSSVKRNRRLSSHFSFFRHLCAGKATHLHLPRGHLCWVLRGPHCLWWTDCLEFSTLFFFSFGGYDRTALSDKN